MTELTQIQAVPAVKPLMRQHLGSLALAKHKATLIIELDALAAKYNRYGWDDPEKQPIWDRVKADWMEALQDYPLSEVQAACAASVLSNPNKMPNEGHVKAQIIAARQKAVRAQPKPVEVTPERGPVSAEMKARSDAMIAQFRTGVAQ